MAQYLDWAACSSLSFWSVSRRVINSIRRGTGLMFSTWWIVPKLEAETGPPAGSWSFMQMYRYHLYYTIVIIFFLNAGARHFFRLKGWDHGLMPPPSKCKRCGLNFCPPGCWCLAIALFDMIFIPSNIFRFSSEWWKPQQGRTTDLGGSRGCIATNYYLTSLDYNAPATFSK